MFIVKEASFLKRAFPESIEFSVNPRKVLSGKAAKKTFLPEIVFVPDLEGVRDNVACSNNNILNPKLYPDEE
ncbi:MAG: hypothetical protein UW19_C0007G0053 [Candidatus Moranbacteria bacterium GW2011_GWF2_44_10]|nr:MAG: hypothetical protein UW19_C0007G0053 [Candidatus Moranbacteria bacterium GW2011_GWF2_44_10]